MPKDIHNVSVGIRRDSLLQKDPHETSKDLISERPHSRQEEGRGKSINQDFGKHHKGANYSSRIFLTAAPNKDAEYRIEKEKQKLQKMFKMRDNVK